MQVDHRGDLDLVESLVPFDAGGKFVHFLAAGDGHLFLLAALGHVREHHPGNKGQQEQVQVAHGDLDIAHALQPHHHLRPDLEPYDGAHQHDHAQFVVDVAEPTVPHGRDQRLAGHMGNVGTDCERHRKSQDVQAGRHHPCAAHAEEAADDPNAHEHDKHRRYPSRRSNRVVVAITHRGNRHE